MSAKYELIGKYWDEQKIEKKRKWKTIDFSEVYTNYTNQLSLFDLGKVKKKIMASELLNVNNDRDFYNIYNRTSNCNSLALVLNNEDCLTSTIVKDFYYKRLNDVAQKLKNENPDIEIIFMKEREHEIN